MAKFDNEQYIILYDGDEYHQGARLQPCWICGVATAFFSISFEAHICSAECADKAWNSFKASVNSSNDGVDLI